MHIKSTIHISIHFSNPKSGVGKFMVEISGVEKSGVERSRVKRSKVEAWG